jgi:hypothetical protein
MTINEVLTKLQEDTVKFWDEQGGVDRDFYNPEFMKVIQLYRQSAEIQIRNIIQEERGKVKK